MSHLTINPDRCPKHSYQLREVQPSKRDPLNFKKFYIFVCRRCGSTVAISNIHFHWGRYTNRTYTDMIHRLSEIRK